MVLASLVDPSSPQFPSVLPSMRSVMAEECKIERWDGCTYAQCAGIARRLPICRMDEQ